MSDLQCPHCHATVLKGATICTGCEAEVEYGIPGNVVYIMLIVATVVGYMANDLVGSGLVGLIAGFAVFIGISERLNMVFRDRVEFKAPANPSNTEIA